MSGICDTCRREPCPMRFDGCKTCDVYEGGETRYEQLFGTPERAARTLSITAKCFEPVTACRDCMYKSYCNTQCDYNALLEWMSGDAE